MINYLTLKEYDNKHFQILFVDFSKKENNNEKYSEINPDTFSQLGIIDEKYINDEKILENFTNKLKTMNIQEYNSNGLKYNTINMLKNMIAVEGRIKTADYILIKEEDYKNYENDIKKSKLNVVFSPYLENNIAYLYSKNDIDQPGVVLITYKDTDDNELYYKILDVGLIAQKQFLKIIF